MNKESKLKKILLPKSKEFRWPMGTVCRRDRQVCVSYEHDKRCFGDVCPFRGNNLTKKVI